MKQNSKRPVYEMGLGIFCQASVFLLLFLAWFSFCFFLVSYLAGASFCQHCTRAPRVKERLRDLLLDLIRKERDGEKIDRSLSLSLYVCVCMCVCVFVRAGT